MGEEAGIGIRIRSQDRVVFSKAGEDGSELGGAGVLGMGKGPRRSGATNTRYSYRTPWRLSPAEVTLVMPWHAASRPLIDYA